MRMCPVTLSRRYVRGIPGHFEARPGQGCPACLSGTLVARPSAPISRRAAGRTGRPCGCDGVREAFRLGWYSLSSNSPALCYHVAANRHNLNLEALN